LLAKEAVVGTLDATCSALAAEDAGEAGEETAFSLIGGIGEAFAYLRSRLALLERKARVRGRYGLVLDLHTGLDEAGPSVRPEVGGPADREFALWTIRSAVACRGLGERQGTPRIAPVAAAETPRRA
jgi:hypothetical protein